MERFRMKEFFSFTSVDIIIAENPAVEKFSPGMVIVAILI
jgi:hypothetical protein